MPKLGKTSLARLATCHPLLQKLFLAVAEDWDCNVQRGARGKDAQDAAVASGASTTPWPTSKHNKIPSEAADVYPWVNGKQSIDADVCREFGGFVLAKAMALGIKIRWGGDWDGDHDLKDQTFNDLVHFEVIL